MKHIILALLFPIILPSCITVEVPRQGGNSNGYRPNPTTVYGGGGGYRLPVQQIPGGGYRPYGPQGGIQHPITPPERAREVYAQPVIRYGGWPRQ